MPSIGKFGRFSRGAAAFAVALGLTLPALGNPYEKTLTNGMRVIVQEDRRAPTVVHMVWYRVGAMDEVDGRSGLAHALEHMMFKGTRTLKAGEFNRRVAAAGGRDNAFTSLDYTAYFQQVPKDALPEMMSLEADRMRHLVLDQEEFGKEIQVVMEERRLRTDDQPQAMLYERLMATAFQAHPYRRPVIGWMDDLRSMTLADLQAWYRQWYAPNNAYLVVVGDVSKDEVFRLAEQHYGPLTPQTLPERKPQREPEQLGVKTLRVAAPARLPALTMAWKAPLLRDVAKDREPYALEVLAGVLDGHDAARLPRNLVRGSHVAVSAGAGYDNTARGEGIFTLTAMPSEGKTTADVEQALRGEIARLQAEAVAPAELERVKNQVIAAQIFKRDSMFAQAMEIGRTEAAGLHWKDIDRMVEGIRRVTAAEVQAAAKSIFNDKTLTVAVLDPLPVGDAPRRSAAPALRH